MVFVIISTLVKNKNYKNNNYYLSIGFWKQDDSSLSEHQVLIS